MASRSSTSTQPWISRNAVCRAAPTSRSSIIGARRARTSPAWCAMCWSTRSAIISASATTTWRGSRRRIDRHGNAGTQLGQGFGFEPCVVTQPACRAPAWVRHNENLGQELAPAGNHLGHRSCSGARDVVADRIAADEQGELDGREEREQLGVPQRCTFAARRQIAAFAIAAGVAKSHRRDRYPSLVVKGFAIERQPRTEPVTAAVVEGEAGLVHPRSGGLADDQKPCGGPSP